MAWNQELRGRDASRAQRRQGPRKEPSKRSNIIDNTAAKPLCGGNTRWAASAMAKQRPRKRRRDSNKRHETKEHPGCDASRAQGRQWPRKEASKRSNIRDKTAAKQRRQGRPKPQGSTPTSRGWRRRRPQHKGTPGANTSRQPRATFMQTRHDLTRPAGMSRSLSYVGTRK